MLGFGKKQRRAAEQHQAAFAASPSLAPVGPAAPLPQPVISIPRELRLLLSLPSTLALIGAAVVVALVLRSVVRRAGPDAVARHWPGTPDGLVAVLSLAGASGQRGPGASRGRAA